MIKIPVDYAVIESRRVNTALGQDSQCILLALPPIRSLCIPFSVVDSFSRKQPQVCLRKTKGILYIFAVASPAPSSQGAGMPVCQSKNGLI